MELILKKPSIKKINKFIKKNKNNLVLEKGKEMSSLKLIVSKDGKDKDGKDKDGKEIGFIDNFGNIEIFPGMDNFFRETLIKILEPFMDKTPSFGCYIQNKYSFNGKVKKEIVKSCDNFGKEDISYCSVARRNGNIHTLKLWARYSLEDVEKKGLCKEDFLRNIGENIRINQEYNNIKIYGHYDLSAITRYIADKKLSLEYRNNFFWITERNLTTGKIIKNYGKILNKSLEEYSYKEEYDLIQLLLNLKNIIL